jgi:membrane-associated PAP2 superfamily phosphatase
MSKALGFDRTLWPGVAALALVLTLFELTPLDLWVQDRFFDFETGRWLVDRDEPLGRAFFYTGPKVLIIALGVWVLAAMVAPATWRARAGWWWRRRDLAVAFLALATIPALIGWGKDTTNVFCPAEIQRYGGTVPYVKVFERFPPDQRPERTGRCFPAGHASGGFALLGFVWLGRTRRARVWLFAGALAVGWTMGLYQMLKGSHYLSHTLVTMLVAWIGVLLWRRVLRAYREGLEPSESAASL